MSKYRRSIPHYCLLRKDRSPSRGKGGGLIVCVKSSLDFSEIDVILPTGNNLEILSVTVHGFSVFILLRIGLHSDGLCDNCAVPETVDHFLTTCFKYREA